MAEFTHLHLHSDYSLLDGACDIDKLVARVAAMGQTAVAVTDHGNIYGAVHLFDAAQHHNVKPILGCELYICAQADHRADPEGNKEYFHLTVLAESDEGYRNLVRITSEASLYGFYHKPRISKKFLADHSQGLIGLSGCLSGELACCLLRGDYAAARTVAKEHEAIFGRGNYFLEIQDQGIEPEQRINPELYKLSKDLDIPLVATNDSHYLCDDDSHAHEILLCVQTGTDLTDPKRMRFDADQFFVKSADQMAHLFRHSPDALARTMAIAERCSVKLQKVGNPFPEFTVPAGHTIDSYFEQVCRAGYAKRRATSIQYVADKNLLRRPLSEYDARLEREIDCIKQMKFAGYFLIVWDFIRYARECGIPVGPGRGSAAGSLVSYALEITDIDPLQNGLLFERFLNPERVSLPDIDIDFCMNRRDEVISYVREKYGRDQVAQIITFNTMAAKAAVKDVGRAMTMPYGEVDRVAKLIPATIGITLDQALIDSPPLRVAYETDPKTRELIDVAKKLEGLVRGAGVHAAGVVISPRPLLELVPITRAKNGEIVTAYDMKAIEKIGLLKMDFLGLTTLTIIDDALRLIQKNQGVTLDMSKIPLDDAQIYERVFHRALTSGVFQFESGGMRDVLRRYKPNCVEDLTALNALYRPGPIQGGMIDDFIEYKWGRKTLHYDIPELLPILQETFGVIVYQEQVMEIANKLAGYSLGEADLLRRAMGKKNPTEMAAQRDRFVRGAVERGFPEKKIIVIFNLMERFAGYGFNKSHSAAYALLAYQTAYLKTHYPVEFMAALLTSQTSNPDSVVKYIKECREMGIPVAPPDVQLSDAHFTPHGDTIRFGLTAIKNVGANAIENVITARNALIAEGKSGFASFWDFCERIDLRLLNKRVLESLIKSGAMDSFGRRAQMAAALDQAMDRAQKAQKDHVSGQHGLFGIFDSAGPASPDHVTDPLPNTPDWTEAERLQNEKEVLGYFVSGHPLDKYADKLKNLNTVDTAAIAEMKPSPPTRRGQPESEIAVAGIICNLKVQKSRKGDLYANAVLEDATGKVELICFPEAYKRLSAQLTIEVPVLVRGSVRAEEEAAPKLAISSITALEDVKVTLPENVRVRVRLNSASEGLLDSLFSLVAERPGPGKLMIDLEQEGEYVVVLEPEGVRVAADRIFIERAELRPPNQSGIKSE
jgi:DNA polymerase-3 subunit alpha